MFYYREILIVKRGTRHTYTHTHTLDNNIKSEGRNTLLVQAVFLSNVRFQFDEFFGDFVVCALRQNPEDGPPRFVHLDTFTQRKPTCTRTLKYGFLISHKQAK